MWTRYSLNLALIGTGCTKIEPGINLNQLLNLNQVLIRTKYMYYFVSGWDELQKNQLSYTLSQVSLFIQEEVIS